MLNRHTTCCLVAGLILPAALQGAGTDRDPAAGEMVLDRVAEAVDAGRFEEAEQMLRAEIHDPAGPVVDDRAVALEAIRRLRMEYSVTPEAMLEKIREDIPDVTAADVDRWRQAGSLQHRVIDGQVRYFRREPSNLFRFCKEAQSRRPERVQRSGWKFSLPEHLARLVKRAETSPGAEVFPVRHQVTYRLKVRESHPRVKPGATVRCWLPFPQEYRQQRDVRLLSAQPDGAVLASNGHPQRTVYFERTVDDPAQPIEFTAEFEFVTSAYVPRLDPAKADAYDAGGALFRENTAERPPHIVFAPEVQRIVREVAGDESNPLLRAKKLFRWMCENVRYCSELEYSTIRNISDKALTTRRGDCGVQALAFITLCRAAGVPARWQSGWETLPNGWNMHDWAEFYVEPWGWLPADPSYGLQEHADPRVREFFFGHLDPYRMIVNLDYARELTPPKTSWRSEPNDFQRGEIEIDGHNLYFDEWDWTFDVRTVPLEPGLASLEEALDAAVPHRLEDGGMCGAIVAVGRKSAGGYDTWRKAYGFQRTEPQRVPMAPDAVFDLASMTKPIATGTSMMLLAERGKLSIDDPVSKYLPEFKVDSKKDVTIRQLMTHMSGEKPYVHADEQKRIKEKAGFPCPAELRAYVRGLDLTQPPGQTVVYSCLNAILCAEIVETVSGTPLDRFAAENIFEPLGMKDTGFNPPSALASRIVPTTRAERGRGEGGFLQGQTHDPLAAMQGGVSGNAGLFGTVADLERFAQMILNDGELAGVRILKPETVRLMTSVQNPGAKNAKGNSDRRGLLWDMYYPDPGDKGVDALQTFGHTGYTGTAIRFYPEQGIYVIALANRVHPNDSGKVDAFRRAIWETLGETLLGVGDRARATAPSQLPSERAVSSTRTP